MINTKLRVNTTNIPDKEVEWLLNFAANTVNVLIPKKKRLSDEQIHMMEVRTTSGRRSGCYYGKHKVIVRIDTKAKYPYVDKYAKFEDMPKITVNSWQEMFVGLVAHELGHYWYAGTKAGEFKCELLSHDVIEYFRKNSQKYDDFVAKLPIKVKKKIVTKQDKEFDKKVRWIKKYCADNDIKYNLIRNSWSDELSFEIQGYCRRNKVFEGMGDYMYCDGAIDAYERLLYNPIVEVVNEKV